LQEVRSTAAPATVSRRIAFIGIFGNGYFPDWEGIL